jgi:hypothetical protein
MLTFEGSIATRAVRAESERWAVIRRRMAELELEVAERLKLRAEQMRGEMRALFEEDEWIKSVRSTMVAFEKTREGEIAEAKSEVDALVQAANESRSDLRAREEQKLAQMHRSPNP